MTDDPSGPALSGTGNPFPPTAVASGAETVTVETPAVRTARHLLDEYLSAPAQPGSGNIIAIVGDYGTGKTHLAHQLLRHIGRTVGDTTHTIDLEASTGNFVLLYQNFVTRLDQMDVMRRVREYYTDIVADELASLEVTADLAPKLRSGELDLARLTDQLDLMEGDLLLRVRRQLEDVTRKEEFGTALTLLLRTGFDRAVWEWFRGGVPDQILVDRGIRDPIATDADALEAMGVFALLYGHRGHRFVLVIDELDKLLSTSRDTVLTTVDAFKMMLQVFAAANALLILVGLPDYIDAVGATVMQRVSRIIRVSALTTDHAEEYIRRSQQEAGGIATLAPFTRDTVKYLVEITDGVARRVVRLCHHLYRKAVSEGTNVTEAMVREAARAQLGFVNVESVRREVRRVLDGQGLRYLRNHLLGSDDRTRVDYWIPLGDRDSGCAVLLTDSVFSAREVHLLNERAILIKNAVVGADTVLVVVGYLPSALSQDLTETFGIEPLVYDHWMFNESLAAILSTRAVLIEDASAAEDPLTVVHNRIERITRQQTNTQRFVEQLAAHVEAMRGTSDHEFGVIRRGLADITAVLQSARGGHTPQQGTGSLPNLPQSVSALFDDASSALSALSRVDASFREALAGAGRSLSNAVEARMALRSRLVSSKVFEAMGVISMLRTLLTAFRDAVTDWYRSHAVAVREADKAELGALCRSYDALYDFLPLFRLNELDEFEVSQGGADDSFRQAARSTRLTSTYDAFDSFGSRVQAALLSAVAHTES